MSLEPCSAYDHQSSIPILPRMPLQNATTFCDFIPSLLNSLRASEIDITFIAASRVCTENTSSFADVVLLTNGNDWLDSDIESIILLLYHTFTVMQENIIS